MTFEFLVACHMTAETNIRQALTELLAGVLVDNQNDFDEGIVADMIQLRHKRSGGEVANDNGGMSRHTLISFALELPEDTSSIESVIEDFAKALPDTPPVFHTVKFEDPLLQGKLAEYASEIFVLEMKLRRVLSLIYLHAYRHEKGTFELLREETVQIPQREQPRPDQMKAAGENQFFHLVFSQYINLNKRPDPQLPHVLEFIRNSEQYDAFRAAILRDPIEHEKDAEFLTNLKNLMDPIERMRNCVAHNRRPTKSVVDNYPNAREELEERLNEYLSQWEVQ
jgi:hypothetical protein